MFKKRTFDNTLRLKSKVVCQKTTQKIYVLYFSRYGNVCVAARETRQKSSPKLLYVLLDSCLWGHMTDMTTEKRTIAGNQEIHWQHKGNDDITKKKENHFLDTYL